MFKIGKNKNPEIKIPPERSNNVFSDIRNFLINKPEIDTLIRFRTEEERENYNHRIMQRFGINVFNYKILNVHHIGIEAPPSYVFNELLRWDGDSTCWPNHIAKVKRTDENIEKIKILLFGWKKYPFGWEKSFLGFRFIPLFLLNSIKIKSIPDSFDFDNARYLLYKCSGGYPIGIFAMYVRSSIEDMGEQEQTQLYFTVGFNFYGNERISSNKIINKIWESIHNRVTANVLNRIKQLSEWRIDKMQEYFWETLRQ